MSLVLNFTGPVLPVQSSFVHLRHCFPLLLYITDQNKQWEIWTCISSPTKHSDFVGLSFLSRHLDLWKPHVAIFFILFCVFPSEEATETRFPLLLLLHSLALTDRARGHCHLLMLNSCLHPLYPPPPCPLSPTASHFQAFFSQMFCVTQTQRATQIENSL